ncbi:TetR family transcriptional regulator [Gammaproteobacteria bacterium 42_54_T18]|nr:TetR family transcriptional regulator [Gammaproteobacteria bacterium 42_54_T18]
MNENLERRTRILIAAKDTFAKEGFRNAEVKTIAQVAGVGKATIYKHFDSKDHLLLTIVEENFNAMRDVGIATLIGNGRALERFEKTCLAIAKFLDTDREFSLVVVKEAGEIMTEIERLYKTVMEENKPFSDAFINALKDEKLIPDLPNDILLELIMNLAIGTVYSWTLSGTEPLSSKVTELFGLWKRQIASTTSADHQNKN